MRLKSVFLPHLKKVVLLLFNHLMIFLNNHIFVRIINHVKGERLEIFSYESGKLLFHGEFNEKREREGWGIEYDEKSGSVLLEGIWEKNKLVKISRKIEERS